MKKRNVFSLIAMLIMAVAMCVCFAACGSTVAGTYTLNMSGADIKGKTEHGGFVDTMVDLGVITDQKNTLVLNGDKTYDLTKEIMFDTTVPAAQGQEMTVKYVFSGTYTFEENKVTLSAATYCTAVEKWGMAGTSLGEKDTDSEDDEDLLNYFATQYWEVGQNVEQTVTIDTEKLNFTY